MSLAEKVGKLKLARKWYYRQIDKHVKRLSKVGKFFIWEVPAKCYTSIHNLPINIWHSISETKEVGLLMKQKRPLKYFELKALKTIYSNIKNEFIKEFGWGEQLMALFEVQLEIVERVRLRILEGDTTQQTWIDIAITRADEIIQSLKDQGVPTSYMETIAFIEGTLHVQINVETCSVAKFYGYLKACEKINQNGKQRED